MGTYPKGEPMDYILDSSSDSMYCPKDQQQISTIENVSTLLDMQMIMVKDIQATINDSSSSQASNNQVNRLLNETIRSTLNTSRLLVAIDKHLKEHRKHYPDTSEHINTPIQSTSNPAVFMRNTDCPQLPAFSLRNVSAADSLITNNVVVSDPHTIPAYDLTTNHVQQPEIASSQVLTTQPSLLRSAPLFAATMNPIATDQQPSKFESNINSSPPAVDSARDQSHRAEIYTVSMPQPSIALATDIGSSCSIDLTAACITTSEPTVKSSSLDCSMCGQSFSDSDQLSNHLKVHGSSYHCIPCNKSFSSSTAVKVHRRLHSGERPFQCTFCPKAFTQSSNLNTHTRIHTRERPFWCSGCGSTFTRKESLSHHRRVYGGTRAFNCHVCSEPYTMRCHLNRHKGLGLL